MKKYLFAIVALALSVTSCSNNKETQNEASEITEVDTVEVVANAEVDPVIELKDDAKYRPDIKVEKATVIDFNATWCPPCQRLKPVFHSLAGKYPEVEFVSIDTDVNPETAKAFGIESIPTIIVMTPEGKMETVVGPNPEDLEDFIKANI